jgi:hypothetical protein
MRGWSDDKSLSCVGKLLKMMMKQATAIVEKGIELLKNQQY